MQLGITYDGVVGPVVSGTGTNDPSATVAAGVGRPHGVPKGLGLIIR